MALLKLGGLVTNISGRIGGNILGTSPNGSYIKSNSYSQQHPSPAQSLQRTQLYPITQLWSTLNSTQKALWDAEVINYPYVNRVGDTVYYSGYQLFLNCNMGRQLSNLSPLTTPATFETPNIPNISLEQTSSTEFITNYSGNDVNNRTSIFWSAPLALGITPSYDRQRFYVNTPRPNTSGYTSTSDEYFFFFPIPSPGQTISLYWKVMNKNTGYISGKTILASLVWS